MATDEGTCSICQDGYEEDSAAAFLACAHKFHQYCVRQYCNDTNTTFEEMRCPLCRTSSAEAERSLITGGDAPVPIEFDPAVVELDPADEAADVGEGPSPTNVPGLGAGAEPAPKASMCGIPRSIHASKLLREHTS